MSVFAGIEHVPAEGTFNRQYFEPGNYTVLINRVFIHEKRLGGGRLFIVETTVQESDNENIKQGDERNWVQSLAMPSALPRIKSFIAAASGFCTKTQMNEINEKVNASLCEKVISEKNPLNGVRLKIKCHHKLTRSGKNFTVVQWGI